MPIGAAVDTAGIVGSVIADAASQSLFSDDSMNLQHGGCYLDVTGLELRILQPPLGMPDMIG
jgi:hypothetical protein